MGTAFSLIATSADKSVAGARARRSMRTAVIVGPVCAALCMVLGALQFGQGHGILILTLGCVLSVFWLVMIQRPVPRRA